MMAMAIVVVGVVGMMQAVTLGSESLDTARKQRVATQIAQAEIERLRNTDWTAIAALPTTATLTISPSGAVSGDLDDFALTNFTVATTDDNTALLEQARGFRCTFVQTWLRPSSASAATVTYIKFVYTVTWTSSAGRRHSRQFESYLGKNGLQLSYQQS